MTLAVVHHHGFKCAGSSVVHVLTRNFAERVLHVEHRQPDRRIDCDQVAPLLRDGRHVAVTSHLLTMPRPGEELAPVHFALVRDPLERLRSSFEFVADRYREGGIEGFLARLEHQAANFHVRLLGVPGENRGDGWPCDPDAVPLGAPHVLIGSVERFEDTMFLLERRLAAHGVAFDAGLAQRHNVGDGQPLPLDEAAMQQLRARNAEDYALLARVDEALDRELQQVDPDGAGRREHRARCEARRGVDEPLRSQPPTDWTYLDA
ncbi:MAG: hypothetical protein KAI24_13565 [Planctomycetes bacterium]|nr:hypothetical protein [Planctomycetota bacterium]